MRRIVVSITRQILELKDGDATADTYSVSTSRNGPGEQKDSYSTPRGLHYVRAKIGSGLPAGSILKGRRPTGEIFSAPGKDLDPDRDWVTSRILWLSGKEVGRNRLGSVDSMQRYIYIHGSPHVDKLGTPASAGCVRMSDSGVIELFDMVDAGIEVEILDG